MAEERQRSEWDRTAQITATLMKVHSNKKGYRPDMRKIHPYYEQLRDKPRTAEEKKAVFRDFVLNYCKPPKGKG